MDSSCGVYLRIIFLITIKRYVMGLKITIPLTLFVPMEFPIKLIQLRQDSLLFRLRGHRLQFKKKNVFSL